MRKVRKIAMVAYRIKMEDEDRLDLEYWLPRSPQERISAVTSLRRTYFTWLNGSFPTKWKKLFLKEKGMFEQDFIDFIELLNIHEVEYMIVGTHALSYHGRPRHTGDLDIWINPTSEMLTR